MKFDKFKSFLLGLSISAAIGYYLYQDVKTDNMYLRHELRKSHVEFKNQQMKASEFAAQVSETEKENIENYNINNLQVRKGTSLSIPAIIPVNAEFCRFLGYYVSEGYYSFGKKHNRSVILREFASPTTEESSEGLSRRDRVRDSSLPMVAQNDKIGVMSHP